MADSKANCNTCQPVRSADAQPFPLQPLQPTAARRPGHHCQPEAAELQRACHRKATAALTGNDQPGAGAQCSPVGHASHYGSALAQHLCLQRRRSGRPAVKPQLGSILWGLVSHLLRLHWSPEQIVLTLARLHPQDHEHRVSHETIYNCIYAMPVGELRKERRSQT